jgi:ubiquinol-cytochrome c reductase cytochrome b subunit
MQAPTPSYTWMARGFATVYFLYFLLMPLYTSMDNDKPVPDRVTK